MKSLHSDPAKLLQRLAALVEVCEWLVDQIVTLEHALDDIKQTLADLTVKYPELDAVLQPVKRKVQQCANRRASAPRFAQTIDVKWNADDAIVAIDFQIVKLPRTLGLLVEVLLAPDPQSPENACMGWKPRSRVAALLSKQAGRAVKEHALDNLFTRLRAELRAQADFEELLQTKRILGVRLALRRYEEPGADFPSTQLAE